MKQQTRINAPATIALSLTAYERNCLACLVRSEREVYPKSRRLARLATKLQKTVK